MTIKKRNMSFGLAIDRFLKIINQYYLIERRFKNEFKKRVK